MTDGKRKKKMTYETLRVPRHLPLHTLTHGPISPVDSPKPRVSSYYHGALCPVPGGEQGLVMTLCHYQVSPGVRQGHIGRYFYN